MSTAPSAFHMRPVTSAVNSGASRGVYCQDGLVGGVGPVVSGDRVEIAAVPAQGQGGAQDEALGQDVAVLAEQVVGLTEDEVQLAGVVVPDLQADHASRAAGGPGRRVDGPAGDEPACPQFPAVRCQQTVQGG